MSSKTYKCDTSSASSNHASKDTQNGPHCHTNPTKIIFSKHGIDQTTNAHLLGCVLNIHIYKASSSKVLSILRKAQQAVATLLDVVGKPCAQMCLCGWLAVVGDEQTTAGLQPLV